MKITYFLILFLSVPLSVAYASGKVQEPSITTTAQPVSGKNPSGESSAISVGADGVVNVNTASSYSSVVNGIVTIADVGATDRQQLPDIDSHACTIQALSGNSGDVYLGGSTVTNSSGSNAGIVLTPGASMSNIGVTNANLIYTAADTASDGVAYVCN